VAGCLGLSLHQLIHIVLAAVTALNCGGVKTYYWVRWGLEDQIAVA
jgi:hypothetical protein